MNNLDNNNFKFRFTEWRGYVIRVIEDIDKHIVEKIVKYKEIHRPVYLVLYPHINWSPEVNENIYRIITNFDIDLVLEKSTDWSS